ncbi:RagB/SusD family nutrient uptake outer membrane protein [Pedobacter sp. MC2016-05]|uniref:RagB/SusD family nutrient uptake outer membrane protein n=1 Tax=Pedobacter sp. MC2016-05 TaxID=2994474 RepID=UPI00224676D5|nr:RagB/SusD family nutrient uptake outer membrane protein [Pedobacter sp. MC2016-05]MCX2477005.1 RagB/SusD family nutrient uptake outer membrane protein [Pedobacter sp. MC2016-05]
MKLKLNHSKIASILLLVTVILVSCKKVVEVTPYSRFTTANFFKTVPEAYAATMGVYETMKSARTYGYHIPLLYDLENDMQFISPGNTANDFRDITQYRYQASHPFLYSTWTELYAGIDRANLVIAAIPQMEKFTSGSDTEKADLNRLLGEAKFLRAFYYSDLVRLWGDVPFKTKNSVAGDDLATPLTDRYVIYEQLFKDMEEAIAVLPASLPVNERINKFGAKAILARVALAAGGYSLRADGTVKRPEDYLKYYRLAQTHVNDVIASNLYQLNASYSRVFKNQSSQIFEPKESLFEASFFSPTAATSNSSYFGSFNTPNTTLGVYANGLARHFIPFTFYSSFTDGDLRKDFSVATYRIGANGLRVPLLAGTTEEHTWTPQKWSREYQKGSALEPAQTYINYVIMRYSDVLLMRAEVENELNNGPNQLAYDAINQVRRRAFGTNIAGSGISIAITAGGSGYGNNTTGGSGVTNTGITVTGSGFDAQAVPIVTNGVVTGVRLLNAGIGFTSAPIVSITGSGTGALATATLLPKKTNTDADLPNGLSYTDFKNRLQDERAWELCFEGLRKADLIRWNIFSAKVAETEAALKTRRSSYPYGAGTAFAQANQPFKYWLMPFPLNETDANTKGITRQNPGW